MGDRANVRVTQDGESIYLYTHWNGTNLPYILADALDRARDRWSNGSYLARNIFSQMIQHHVLETTGYGIWPTVGDGDDRIILVNCNCGEVVFCDKAYSFEDYISLVKCPTFVSKF
jgi:hypothetical protein